MSDFILFLEVDDELFKRCFGDTSTWNCGTKSLPENCSKSDVNALLQNPGLLCVVVEDEGPHWQEVVNYYKNGGFVVYFGIMGEFDAPKRLSRAFDVDWKFSAYTKHEFVLTPAGKEVLGDAFNEQPYSKANLLHVPVADRIMVPKHHYPTVEQYIQEECDTDDEDGPERYADIQKQLDLQVPLALHKASHGGRVAYLGFVNGDGNIPKYVRALCTGVKISNA